MSAISLNHFFIVTHTLTPPSPKHPFKMHPNSLAPLLKKTWWGKLWRHPGMSFIQTVPSALRSVEASQLQSRANSKTSPTGTKRLKTQVRNPGRGLFYRTECKLAKFHVKNDNLNEFEVKFGCVLCQLNIWLFVH